MNRQLRNHRSLCAYTPQQYGTVLWRKDKQILEIGRCMFIQLGVPHCH